MANDITRMLGASNYSYLFNNNSAKRQNSISSLWSNYGSFQSNAANNLAALTEVRQNSAAVIESYNEAKDTFYTGFDDAMAELKESAGKVKNLDFNVGENAITKTEVTDENGEVVKDENGNAITKTTYSETMQNALDTVKDFISDYNDALSFLKDNSAISSRIERTANNFADTTYRASIYESIGINVGSDGTLSIDEEKLANSIVNDPDKVSSVLGEKGLASKAESHVDNANAQRSNLFPSAKTMLGKQLEQAEIYTGNAFVNMSSISNVGNLINMMF
jgi:sporulation protein YlmC with PRC-barrel domain